MNQVAEQGAAPGWLHALRENAAGQFRVGGLPHRKVEAWKYTPMGLLEGVELTPGPMEPGGQAAERVAPSPLCERGLLVDICDGQVCSAPPGERAGLTVLSLDQGIQRFEDRLKPLFESVSLDGPTRAFAALNTAFARQGLVAHVAAGGDAGRLLLRWYFRDAAVRELRHFRVFVLLDEGARLDLIEQYQSISGAPGALNVVLQADLAAGASLRHTRLQAEPEDAMLLTSTALEQAGDSCYLYRGFDLGSSLARHELTVRLRGDGAVADLAGAFVLDGKRHVDNHVCVEHLAPGCSSEQFFRGVLGGRSRGVFNGRALIQPGADGSSVRQSNANLLLSPLAEMDTKPELEIYADEVEASHGATVGQLDEKAVFYLRSRGLSESEARRLLTVGFCRAVTDKVEGRGLAERIGELLDAAMPTDSL